ncbi:TPA_asm: hypothetical protein HUJ06_032033 [Nelumbo nucifera]|uniref:Uncharacterized protein n=1 Tax=Nelumbo nucifera TaxID=4432 RepID=A0A822XZT9_NELNU|nr:TPA_asm: hypothetical protein HUJ06_026961 [Nelumbo nucifera]DAD25562.1 TPA_asm: hypothetical protein HUJ06_027026 [Nelumbo nucifera]DAD49312.1 TPA_asm: hypothetical protein HUJ06_032033 [Nelumbo nucifera]
MSDRFSAADSTWALSVSSFRGACSSYHLVRNASSSRPCFP